MGKDAAKKISRFLSVFAAVGILAGCVSYKTVWDHGGYFTDAESSGFRFSGANWDFRA